MMYFKYLWYVIKHKWFVFLECLKYGLIWRGLVHDWHKLLPDELIPYANFFYGEKRKQTRDETGYYKPTDTGDKAFDFAWLLHQKRGRHHWQYWILPTAEDIRYKVLDMPDVYLKEMLCDWRGAGRAQGTPDVLNWYRTNKDKLVLSEYSRLWIENELGYLF